MPVYVLAAAINLRIPLTGVAMQPHAAPAAGAAARLLQLQQPPVACDRLGQISLSTTTLFWGVSGNLRYIVLAWAGVALGYSTTQARPWWAWWPWARPRRGAGLVVRSWTRPRA